MDYEKLKLWNTAKVKLDELKVLEAKLRKEVLEDFFPTHKEEGTEKVEIGNGYKLKAVFRRSYELVKEEEAIEAAIIELMKTGADGEAAVDGLIKRKIELSTTNYKKLTPSQHAIFDKVVTIKDGMPSMSIEAPKEK